MKKLTALILALVCILSLAACGGPAAESPAPSPAETPVPTVSAPPTPAATATPLPESAPPQDAFLRMERITAEDIKYISSTFSNITATQLADAMRGAAGQQIELTEPLTYTFYSLTAYLSGGPEGYSGNDEHFTFYAGLDENLVRVFYRGLKGSRQEFYLSDSNLYWLIRNNYHSEPHIEEEHYAAYGHIIEARAQLQVDTRKNMLEKPEYSGYDITHFSYVDTFVTDEATYELYSWDVAFLTDDPAHVCWAGGMYLDAEGRVRAAELDTYLAVKTSGENAGTHRFLFWSLFWGEDEASQRENALNSIVAAFSTTAENNP